MHRSSGQLAAEQGFGPFTDAVCAEPFPKRVRARLEDEWVLESTQALLAWIEGPTPAYAIPEGDLEVAVATGSAGGDERLGRVEPVSFEGTSQPVGVRVVDPPETAPSLAGHVVLDWDAVDAWFVEDERQRVHPRDPYKRIDVHESSRHVVVEAGGVQLAESRRPLLVFETGLPIRFYLPRDDVRMDRLAPSPTVTRCAYKGTAEHYHARGNGEDVEDAAWTYPSPEPGFGPLQDLICFYDERVDLVVDGEELDRPETPWS